MTAHILDYPNTAPRAGEDRASALSANCLAKIIQGHSQGLPESRRGIP